jgi:CelD/BcsL family acetyltransferase involved in cellulose biosynthesis
MPDISFDRVTDPDALARRWRALEGKSEGGFFRSWTYLGTLLPQFSNPHLLAVTQGGQDLALGLFNRAHGRLFLHEAGDPVWDSLYVEHNGLLIRPDSSDVLAPALATLLAHGRLVLSGIDAAHLAAARGAGLVELRARHFAPAVDLGALAARNAYLDMLSGNARSQIRRAMRLYGADLALEEAGTVPKALALFDRLVVLHQAAWIARGKPGAFADERICAFHRVLIGEGVPRGEVRLLRVAAGSREIGVLYLFRHGGRVFSYQSGFAAENDARLKPGLVCHTLAIEQARLGGAAVYDFLAGAQRYKTTLAPHGGKEMHWITVHPSGSLSAWWQKARRIARAALGKPLPT